MKNIALLSLLLSAAVGFSQMTPDVKMEALAKKLDQAHFKAVVNNDFAALDSLTSETLMVNNPRNFITTGKSELIAMIKQGSIQYSSFDRVPEKFLYFKDMFVVMGHENVVATGTAPHAGKKIQRRYTDVWMKRDGKWQLQMRHANIICPE